MSNVLTFEIAADSTVRFDGYFNVLPAHLFDFAGLDVVLDVTGEGDVLVEVILARIGYSWERLAGARLTLKVAGVDTLSVLNALVATLKERVRGVKDVQQRRFGGGSAYLDVTATGSAQAFASELEELVVKGRRVEVTGLSANAVELRLVK